MDSAAFAGWSKSVNDILVTRTGLSHRQTGGHLLMSL